MRSRLAKFDKTIRTSGVQGFCFKPDENPDIAQTKATFYLFIYFFQKKNTINDLPKY